MQLSLLEYQPPPELLIEPEPKPEPVKPSPHRHLITHLKLKLRLYQKIQIQFFNAAHKATLAGNANPAMQRMRRHEITRLQNLCDEIKSKLETLTNGCSS